MKRLLNHRTVILWLLALLLAGSFSCSKKDSLYLAENGTSDYRIIIPRHADSVTLMAAEEFRKYFDLATGFELPIGFDNEAVNGGAIFIGNSAPLTDMGLDLRLINEDGFVIRTIGENLVIAGGDEMGTLYGVYTFLEDYLDCRKYSIDVEVVPRKGTIRLGPIDMKQEPAFAYRELHMPLPIRDAHYRNWHKLDVKKGKNEWGLFVHTFDDFIPASAYFSEHPEYFSFLNVQRIPDGQLCLSNPEVFNIVIDSLKANIARKPDALFWSVSQNDTYKACECEPCRHEYDTYGGYSGAMIHFVNRVAAEFPHKVISTLAYQYTRSAPLHIQPAENVNIMFCSIECNRSRPLSSDAESASFRKDTEDWCKLTGNIFMWDYVVQFRNLVSPFPNLRVLQPNIRYFRDNGIELMFQQGSGGLMSEFVELRTYLIAKLLWDPDVDIPDLMEDFCYGYYGPAGKYVLKYINDMHDALERSGGDLGIYGYPYDGINTYLTPDLIRQYEGIFDQAEESVADMPVYRERVRVARLPLEFAIIDISLRNVNEELTLFSKTGSGWQVREDMIDRLSDLTERAKAAGITRYWEHGNYPDDYLETVERYALTSMQNHLALGKPAELLTASSEKYPVGGAAALTDGLKGINDYHFNWLGFEGPDMVAVIDLEQETEVGKIEMDFLQEIKSWVFLPTRVEVFASSDGLAYEPLKSLENKVPLNREGTFVETFTLEFSPVKAMKIKVVASNLGICPGWHPGATYPAWIFCDEVMVW